MASNLSFGNKDEGYAVLDEFFKSLMFHKIMDYGFTRNERDVLLVIHRKTLHFDKWEDRLSMHWLWTAVGISENTLRKTLSQLENKNMIEITRSKGGKTKSNKKYHLFSFSTYLLNSVYRNWESIKDENGFEITYRDE